LSNTLPINDGESSPTHDLSTKKHVSQSVYMHSEGMMLLVKELYEHWRDEPATEVFGGRTMWWVSQFLTYDPATFIEMFNFKFKTAIPFDSGREHEICLMMLQELRKQRGAAPFATN